jgi:hypothetical protein
MYRGFGNPSDVAGAHLPGIIDSFSPELCVTSSGTVFIFWLSAESGSGGAIKYVVSEDGGDTFTAPQVAVEGLTTLARFPHPFGFSQLPGGSFRLETFPTTCAVGESVFVAWTDARESVNGEPTARIYFRHFDGTAWQGSSSGQPLLVGPAVTAQGQHAFHPQLAAAAGTVACAHYEFGPKPSRGATSLIDVVLATSGVHPSSGLAHRTLVTDQPWDPAVDAPLSHGDQSVTFIGDYFGLSGTGAAFDVCWTDTRTGIQELFFQRFLVDLHILNIPDEVGQLIGGVASDGGGGVVLPGGVRPVPPMGPVREVIVAEAIRNLSTLLPRGENRSEIARIADEFVRRGTRSLEGQGKREK